MKRIFARIAALCMVALAGVTAAGCTFETSDWWDQLTCGDHTYEEKEVTKQATCAEEGEVLKVCADCGKEKTFKIEKTEHVTEKVAGKAATCTEAGYTEGEKCVVCDKWVTAPEALPALGHDVVKDEAIEAEDCETPGLTAGSHCKTCGVVLEAQEEVAGAHIDLLNDGTCDVCEGSIFENATYATVKVGDTAGGWYRAKYVEMKMLEEVDYAIPDHAANKMYSIVLSNPEFECEDEDFYMDSGIDPVQIISSYSECCEFGATENTIILSFTDFAKSKSDRTIWAGCEISLYDSFKAKKIDDYVYFYLPESYDFGFDYSFDSEATEPDGTVNATLSAFKFNAVSEGVEKVIFE